MSFGIQAAIFRTWSRFLWHWFCVALTTVSTGEVWKERLRAEHLSEERIYSPFLFFPEKVCSSAFLKKTKQLIQWLQSTFLGREDQGHEAEQSSLYFPLGCAPPVTLLCPSPYIHEAEIVLYRFFFLIIGNTFKETGKEFLKLPNNPIIL